MGNNNKLSRYLGNFCPFSLPIVNRFEIFCIFFLTGMNILIVALNCYLLQSVSLSCAQQLLRLTLLDFSFLVVVDSLIDHGGTSFLQWLRRCHNINSIITYSFCLKTPIHDHEKSFCCLINSTR